MRNTSVIPLLPLPVWTLQPVGVGARLQTDDLPRGRPRRPFPETNASRAGATQARNSACFPYVHALLFRRPTCVCVCVCVCVPFSLAQIILTALKCVRSLGLTSLLSSVRARADACMCGEQAMPFADCKPLFAAYGGAAARIPSLHEDHLAGTPLFERPCTHRAIVNAVAPAFVDLAQTAFARSQSLFIFPQI